MRANRTWTKEEMEYLDESWGTVSMPTISAKLNRSNNAIKVKKYRMKLGPFLENGDYISFNQLLNAIGISGSYEYKKISWIEKRGFPIKHKRINENSFMVVHLRDWWKWAVKNKTFLDFSNFEENALGKEPEWVKEKRKHDSRLKNRYKATPWTPAEDMKLKWLINQNKYYYDDISKIMGRTDGAIQRRIIDLNIKGRPLRRSPHSEWTKEQEEMLIEFIKKGVSYEYMSEEIDKSVKAIRGKVYRLYGTEVLDKARKMLIEMEGN